MVDTRHKVRSIGDELVAGFLAGAAATITRLQLQTDSERRKGRAWKIIRSIHARQDKVRSLYRGLTPNLLGNSTSWAIYFAIYTKLKDRLGRDKDRALSVKDYFLASGVAGVITAVATNPIWVIKTRMLSTASEHDGAYKSIGDGTRQIYATEGVRGFYRGLVPSIVGVSHGALQFMTYETLKQRQISQAPQRQLHAAEYLLLGCLSKIIAGSVTYPFQVVKARLQTYDAQHLNVRLYDLVRQIYVREGLRGFYKGLTPNLLRILPSSGTTFLVYEEVKKLEVCSRYY